MQISNFLSVNYFLYKNQYGFRKSHSTLHPIIHLLNICASAHNHNPPQYTLAIFCDLSKAFDILDHQILQDKLSNIGIRGHALTWISNYLTNRTQYVEIDKHKSSSQNIDHGVPQGSVLGPLLFLIYINDIQYSTQEQILSFADDTTILMTSNNTNQLLSKANETLHNINTWFTANKLHINSSKTKYMIFAPHKKKITINNPLSIGNQPIELVSTTKFLGIHLDSHLIGKHTSQQSTRNYHMHS